MVMIEKHIYYAFFHTSFALLHDYYTQNVSGTRIAAVKYLATFSP